MRWLFIGVGLVLVVVLLLAWTAATRWFFRVRSPRPERLRVRTADGWELTLHYRAGAPRRFLEPVILCHGLGANHHTFEFDPPYSLAQRLSAAGFDCHSVDLRGYGASSQPPRGKRWMDHGVEDHFHLDAPAVLDAALAVSQAPRAFWLGHSMGGLIGAVLAQGPAADRLAGLLLLAAPIFASSAPLVRSAIRLGAWALRPFGLRSRTLAPAIAPFLGHVVLPYTDLVINPRAIQPDVLRRVYANLMSSMSPRTLAQFRDWVVNDTFRSFDAQTDYRTRLAQVRTPVLLMGGTADQLATAHGVRRSHDLLGQWTRRWCCSGGTGETGTTTDMATCSSALMPPRRSTPPFSPGWSSEPPGWRRPKEPRRGRAVR